MAVGRRIFSVVTCIFLAQRLEVVSAQGTFGSDAIAGIVVACVAVLIIVIGVVVVYLVWRSRQRAAKNTNSAAASAASAQESACDGGGHAHPADIPIEAVNRIPPPAYAQPTNRRPPGSHHRRSRTQNAGVPPPAPPPPYYSPSQGNSATAAAAAAAAGAAGDMSCDEAPPEYRSRVGLNSSGTEPRRSDPQSVSIESFAEYPSMRNILLTSSRSSLQGTDSRHGSTQSDRSSSAGAGGGCVGAAAVVSMSPAGRPSSRSRRDSAQGDSAYSKSRSISTSSSALNDPRVSVPEGGLQRKARRSKPAATGHSPGALNRSCPSLVDEVPRINTHHHQPHYDDDDDDDDDHHHHHRRRRRRRRVSEEERREGNPTKSDSTKRGRYQRRSEARAAQPSSSNEYSDDQLQVHRGYSTDSDLGFGGRYQLAGTTQV